MLGDLTPRCCRHNGKHLRRCTTFCRLQAVFLLIGKTSALTMNIAGVIKDWMLIFFSYYLFGAPVTALNLLGYGFCCTGVRSCLFATAFWAACACACSTLLVKGLHSA